MFSRSPGRPRIADKRFQTPLQGLKNVILTPHIGGSTEQAQDQIGGEVARKMLGYFSSGSTMGAVNFPQVQLQARPVGARFSHVHRNVPGMLRRLNEIFVQRDINIIMSQYQETDREVGAMSCSMRIWPDTTAAIFSTTSGPA